MKGWLAVIEQLDNNEQILLMYLADELPLEERREVERLLTVDASFRHELETLRTSQEMVFGFLGSLDNGAGASLNREAVIRGVVREIRRRLAQPQTEVHLPGALPRTRAFSWAYPFAAAAMIILGVSVWLNNQAPPLHQPVAVTISDNENLDLIEDSMHVGGDAQAVAMATQREFNQRALDGSMPNDRLNDLMLSEQGSNEQ